MNVCKRTLVYIVIFCCVFFFSCEKKDASIDTSSITDTAPEGTTVITGHPKSAGYPTDETREQLTVKAAVGEGYTLSYQWYSLWHDPNGVYGNLPTEQVISIELDKLINNSEDSLFKEMIGHTGQSCSTLSDRGRTVYICTVTSTSFDGSKTFLTVSDPAIITIFLHPLVSWYTTSKSIFAYSTIYATGTNTRFAELRDITYGNGYFVAVGNRNFGSGPLGIIAYSNDGRKWDDLITDSPFGKEGISISAVAYGNGRFIAVGAKGIIAYSTDIKTWTPVESMVSEYFTDIVYGNGLFIASFRSGLVYSRDGETWLDVEGFDTAWISCVAYGNGRFFTGTYDGKISFSDDGKTWITIADDTFDSHEIVTIAYGNGHYLAFARQLNDWEPSSYKMGYSNDGETWATFYPSDNDDEWNWIKEIIYDEGYFIAVGYNKTAYSKDGINWNNLGERSSNYQGENYNAVAYGGGYFVAVSDNGIIDYCQWPVAKAIAPVITEQPRWPSSTSTRKYEADTGAVYWAPTLNFWYKPVSFGGHSVQWYRNDTDSTVTGIPIEDADWISYAPDLSRPGTTYYYAIVTNTIQNYFDVKAENRKASVTTNTVAVIIDLPEETEIQELDK